jgi:nucleotide-binding universal stress UspA family protein
MSAVAVPIVPAIELKRILFATDFSEASRAGLPVVAAIAHRYGSKVFVAHAWSPLPYPMTTPEAYTSLENRQEQDVKEAMAGFLKAPDLSGLAIEPVVKCGVPVEELNKVIREERIQLAIVGTHGRSGFKKLLLGSVAEELCRNLHGPVLTVGPHVTARFKDAREIKNILFATDLSLESGLVFPYLASLAHEYGAGITLLHVLPPEAASNPDLQTLAEPLRKEMERVYLPQISPRCKVEFLIEAGDADEKILARARAINADIIGFGVRRASFLATHFQNTVTYKVMVQAECPVLTCRDIAKF